MLAQISVSPASIFDLGDEEGRHRLIDLHLTGESPSSQTHQSRRCNGGQAGSLRSGVIIRAGYALKVEPEVFVQAS
ncbi:hypothetical protein ACLB2K_069181 [Fragaria x ananassa]